MAYHSLHSKKGFCVKSYGTGSAVKLPGSSSDQPNVYPFDTTYEQMYQDLYQKDPHLYPMMIHVDHQFMFQWVRTQGLVYSIKPVIVRYWRGATVAFHYYKSVLPENGFGAGHINVICRLARVVCRVFFFYCWYVLFYGWS